MKLDYGLLRSPLYQVLLDHISTPVNLTERTFQPIFVQG